MVPLGLVSAKGAAAEDFGVSLMLLWLGEGLPKGKQGQKSCQPTCRQALLRSSAQTATPLFDQFEKKGQGIARGSSPCHEPAAECYIE